MKNEKRSTSNESKLAIGLFVLSAICLAAALIGSNGLLTSAPTLGGVGSIVGAAAFFLIGVHFRRSAKVNSETSVNSDKT